MTAQSRIEILSGLRKTSKTAWVLSTFFIIVGIGLGWYALWPRKVPSPSVSTSPNANNSTATATGDFPKTFFPKRHAKLSATACMACHEEVFTDWEHSHHALANRPLDLALDKPAFSPPHEEMGEGILTTLTLENGKPVLITTDLQGESTTYTLDGVIAVTPLRQYLARLPGGRWQATSVAYDPHAKEWFEIFHGEGRQPGEWGHWTGQGMNWNANCAWCHMTDYHKNFDLETNSYHSTWLEQGVSCLQCHTGMEEHVANADKPGYTSTVKTLSPDQIMANCASCHSRRDELHGDNFRPGDAYHQFFSLSLPDQPGLYYPDGQILDEDYVYASFMMSRMGHAGITCLDCHNPHSGQTILPFENNALCMRCHDTGLNGATVIKPLEHSHHAEGSAGNQCVSCHMPETTYMQRDPRRDHGFLSPDPLMTRELGIPNACSTCHSDQSVDWAVEWTEKWYGDRMAERPQRQRAQALSLAYAMQPAGADALLALARMEDVAAWRATYVGLMELYLDREDILTFVQSALKDESPLVRERAVRALSVMPEALPQLEPFLSDEARNVRIAAERAFAANQVPIPNEEAAAEWKAYLTFHADRVDGAFQLANMAIANGNAKRASQLIEQAVQLDQLNPAILHQGAVLYSGLGDNASAEALLMRALQLAPGEPSYHFALGLLAHETGDTEGSLVYFKNAVQLDPEFYRGWYTLGLAYTKLERWEEALEALQMAAPAMAYDPGWQQAYAVTARALRDKQRQGQ